MQVQAYWVLVILGAMLIAVLILDKRTTGAGRDGARA